MTHYSLNKMLTGKEVKNISIDKVARAIYFKVEDHDVCRTVRINPNFAIDYDKYDEVVGLELIRVKRIELIVKKALKDITTILPNDAVAA